MSAGIERLMRIYDRLRRGPVTIEIISKWSKQAGLDVSTRQLYRDLNKLQYLKFSEFENVVEFIDEKNRKTWKLEYEGSSDQINKYDINSFFLFRNFIPACINLQRQNSIEKFEKILYQNLSKNKYQQLIDANELFLRNTNYYENLYGEAEHKLLEDLIWALQNKRTIQILSNDVNASNIRTDSFPYPVRLNPVEMLFHMGRIYFAGLEISTQKLLICPVDKSLKLELTNEAFNRNKLLKNYNKQLDMRFGVAEPTTDKIYSIKIEYTPEYGTAMMNFHWHKTARWKTLKNSNYMLEMRCCISRELIGFVAQGLDKIKVHQPKALKDLLVKKYRDSINLYNGEEVSEERANKDY